MLKDSRLGLLLALLSAASMWLYVQQVLVPYQKADAAAHGRPRGNLSDLYPRWLGTRELLLYHRDPYSPEVTREIQIGYYGRPLDPGRMADPRFNEPKDQQGFAYPLHVIFLLAPTIGLPFPVVQTGFRWLLVILTLASVLLWLRVVRWRPSVAIDRDHHRIDLWQLRRGAGNQAAATDPGSERGACRMRRRAGGWIFFSGGFSAGPGNHQAATCSACRGLADAVGGERLAPSPAFGLELRTEHGNFSGRVGVHPARVDEGVSQCGRRLSPVHRWRGFAAGRADHAVAGKNPGRSGGALGHDHGMEGPARSHDSAAFSTMLALVLAVTLVIVPSFAPYNQVLLLPAVFLIANSWKDLWSRGEHYSHGMRSGVAGGGLAMAGVLRIDAGFALCVPELAAESLDRPSLHEPRHSTGCFGIAESLRPRSIADLFQNLIIAFHKPAVNQGKVHKPRRTRSVTKAWNGFPLCTFVPFVVKDFGL